MSEKRKPGRPPAAEERLKITTYFLPGELAALDAERGKMDRSTAIREAVEFWAAWQHNSRINAGHPGSGPADPDWIEELNEF